MPPKIPEPTGKTRADLIDAYTNGTPGYKLAKGYGVSQGTMSKWLRDWEAPKYQPSADTDPRVDRAEATRLYNNGTIPAALARRYGVTTYRMRSLLSAWEVPQRDLRQAAHLRHDNARYPAGTAPRMDRKEATRLYNEGTSPKKLAQRYGIPTSRMKYLLRTWEVPLRNQQQAARVRVEAAARALDAYRLFP
ncbi:MULTISPECIES: hypothetical protein [unclassified Kitasatospora]|uniref:hypothetical protein n=1 Tax=Kitasatospora sp. NPDC001261 TaxID=3364012 RepID=UPI0036B8749A